MEGRLCRRRLVDAPLSPWLDLDRLVDRFWGIGPSGPPPPTTNANDDDRAAAVLLPVLLLLLVLLLLPLPINDGGCDEGCDGAAVTSSSSFSSLIRASISPRLISAVAAISIAPSPVRVRVQLIGHARNNM